MSAESKISDYAFKDYKLFEAAVESESRKSNQMNGDSSTKPVVGSSPNTTIEKIKIAKKESDLQSR